MYTLHTAAYDKQALIRIGDESHLILHVQHEKSAAGVITFIKHPQGTKFKLLYMRYALRRMRRHVIKREIRLKAAAA